MPCRTSNPSANLADIDSKYPMLIIFYFIYYYFYYFYIFIIIINYLVLVRYRIYEVEWFCEADGFGKLNPRVYLKMCYFLCLLYLWHTVLITDVCYYRRICRTQHETDHSLFIPWGIRTMWNIWLSYFLKLDEVRNKTESYVDSCLNTYWVNGRRVRRISIPSQFRLTASWNVLIVLLLGYTWITLAD